MGSGSSTTKKKKIVTKVQAVVALSKAISRKEEESGDEEEWENASNFIKRSSIRGNQHRMSYNDTSRAWKALNKTMENCHGQFEEIAESAPERRFQNQASLRKHEKERTDPMLLYGVEREIERDEDCHICERNDNLKGTIHGCRVCDKVFHYDCLERKGFLHDDFSIEAVHESEGDIGWSCPACEDLFNLLTDDEKAKVIETFDEMAGNDTSVDVERYLVHRRESYRNLVGIEMSVQREGQEVGHFNQMDKDKSGTIEWWEYAPSACIRTLSRRRQEELLKLVTPREVTKLESFFKTQDQNDTGSITVAEAKIAYGKWLLSLVKEESNGNIPNEWLGELPAEWLGIQKRGSIRRGQAEVTWKKFLLTNAVHIISARVNTVNSRPYLPSINEAMRNIISKEGSEEKALILKEQKAVIKEGETADEETMDPLEKLILRMKKQKIDGGI